MPKKYLRNSTESPFENGEFADDMVKLAKESIRLFLGPKNSHQNKRILKKELLSDSSIKTVLRTPFDDETFLYIHDHCLSKLDPGNTKKTAVSWNVQYLLGLLQEMRWLRLPKDFQPGLLLLYFKFCKGLVVPNPPIF